MQNIPVLAHCLEMIGVFVENDCHVDNSTKFNSWIDTKYKEAVLFVLLCWQYYKGVVKNNTKKLLEDYVPWSKDVVAFKINEKDHPYCKFFGISEIHFIDHVRNTQLDRALKWEKKNL